MADVLLEPLRGGDCAELTATAYIDRHRRPAFIHCVNTRDKRSCLSSVANADSAILASKTGVTDLDIVTAYSEIRTGGRSQGDVKSTGRIVQKRIIPTGRVVDASVIVEKSFEADSRVIGGGGVPIGALGNRWRCFYHRHY